MNRPKPESKFFRIDTKLRCAKITKKVRSVPGGLSATTHTAMPNYRSSPSFNSKGKPAIPLKPRKTDQMKVADIIIMFANLSRKNIRTSLPRLTVLTPKNLIKIPKWIKSTIILTTKILPKAIGALCWRLLSSVVFKVSTRLKRVTQPWNSKSRFSSRVNLVYLEATQCLSKMNNT